jgi:predicted nucleic-acid-binding Zn-ribbon protein
MRLSHRCTKCGVTELLHLPQTGHFGLFEAFICVECGYTEMYAHKGAQAVLKSSGGAKRLRGPREPGPYR